MGTIETFDHTADVGLRIRGETLDDLFRTAAEAVFDYVVVNRTEVRPVDAEKIALHDDSTADLLAAWIGDLIFRSEIHHRLFGAFEVHVADDGRSLVATAWGESIDPGRHVLDHEVKAVTRHGLTLDRDESGGWFAEFILDI